MRYLYFCQIAGAIFLSAAALKVTAQNFTNGDLNGTVGVSTTPTGWSQIPYTDPVSAATGVPQATSDVTSATGPLASAGIAAVPHSGTTCVTGLQLSSGTSTWHEGIMQTVSGFTPGNNYTITFYQAVVQQSNATDLTGGWFVFRDATSLGMTAPSTSSLAYNNVNVVWNQRTVNFAATAASHTLKFLPADDDANWNSPAGVRMGIDLISISPAVVLPVAVELNAIRTNAGVKLSWEVRAEDQVQEGILERSRDGEHFEPFFRKRLPAAGQHETEDRQANAGLAYYRLGFVLGDGSTVYSEVKTVKSPIDLLVYAHDNVLHIQSAAGEVQHEVQIHSLTGASVFEGQVQDQLGLGFLSPGVYVVQVRIAGQEGSMLRKKVRVD